MASKSYQFNLDGRDRRTDWSIDDYVQELMYLEEISEHENVDNYVRQLKREVKERFSKKSRKTMGFVQ